MSWTINGDISVHVIRYEDMFFRPSATFSKVLYYPCLEVRPGAAGKPLKLRVPDRASANPSPLGDG